MMWVTLFIATVFKRLLLSWGPLLMKMSTKGMGSGKTTEGKATPCCLTEKLLARWWAKAHLDLNTHLGKHNAQWMNSQVPPRLSMGNFSSAASTAVPPLHLGFFHGLLLFLSSLVTLSFQGLLPSAARLHLQKLSCWPTRFSSRKSSRVPEDTPMRM